VRRSRSGIGHLSGKHGIRDPGRTLIAGIVGGKTHHLLAPGHPWLELPRTGHHLLDAAAPYAQPHAIEDDMGNGGHALLGLAGRLKGDGPDQVVALLGRVVRKRRTQFEDQGTGGSEVGSSLRGRRWKTPGRIAERRVTFGRAAEGNERKHEEQGLNPQCRLPQFLGICWEGCGFAGRTRSFHDEK
jgi:hypothetical protein